MDVRPQTRNGVPERNVANGMTGQGGSAASSNRRNQTSKKRNAVIGFVLVAALLAALAYSALGVGSQVDRSKYQAVFLDNGQVYFGKLSGWNTQRPTLTDVYYFQATGQTTEGNAAQGQGTASSTQTLIKLGEEVHKPSDKLIFNRDAILFVENIEDDGQVVEAIKKNKENK